MCDGPEIGWVKMVKARKQYWCCECPVRIEVGELHECATGLWEGSWETFRTCWGCAEKRRENLKRLGEDCFVYGMLAEELTYEPIVPWAPSFAKPKAEPPKEAIND